MLDKRAWIFAAIIMLIAAGFYGVWLRRTRAVYHARSLSASRPTANTVMQRKSLHVEGCKDDFIVSPGELVEPRVVPGASADQFRAVYGKESSRTKDGALVWEKDAFTLTETDGTKAGVPAAIHLDLHQGHVVTTLDGIELGIDSFGAIFRKMGRDRKVEIHESMQGGMQDGMQGRESGWTLILSLYSSCGRSFRSEYKRTLPASSEIDPLIRPKNAAPQGSAAPWKSNVFMNKVVSQYTFLPSNGQDKSPDGVPSEHD